MEPLPRVHVLVVNYGGWSDTLECLESVFRLDYPDFRVIVCDNGSRDGSLEQIEAWADGRLTATPSPNERLRPLSQPPVHKPLSRAKYERAEAEQGGMESGDARLVLVQTGANLGFAGGNNVGLRYLLARAESGYVWLLNNDTVVAPDALKKLVDVAQADPAIGVVGARLSDYISPDVLQAAGGGRIRRWHGVGRPWTDEKNGGGDPARIAEGLDYITGASMLIPLRVLKPVGLLDERYFAYSEEADWCFRVRAAGFRLAYCPTAHVWHKEGRSIGRGSPLQDYYIERNALMLVRRFFAPFLPLAIPYSMYRSLLPKLVRGEWDRAAAVLRAYRDFARVS
jgi:GT2 family glycosyltransferase